MIILKRWFDGEKKWVAENNNPDIESVFHERIMTREKWIRYKSAWILSKPYKSFNIETIFINIALMRIQFWLSAPNRGSNPQNFMKQAPFQPLCPNESILYLDHYSQPLEWSF